MATKEEEQMINDYITRQLAKANDGEQRIQEQLDLIYELAFGEDN